ncbi:Mpo1 family 2-hydroxy fatty acid dioxygenase [Aeromonas simiae]|uniref:Mpo1 family 2-hydroxy fatty acid dioxygenase n=1 Tax=Aeromonas simiae TaxID=218936 RepID=UPI0005AA6778|nr:Mpo1-like protein [Aeromonas simiae]
MKSIDAWFAAYATCHRHPGNLAIHQVAVPGIYLSVIGLLQALPAPVGAGWGALIAIPVLLFYLRLSFSLCVGMALFTAAGLWLWQGMAAVSPIWPWALTLFVLLWLAQFIGHRWEGRRPAFFTDLQFLLIGPLWVLAGLYRRLRIPY